MRNIGKKMHKFTYTYEDISKLTGLSIPTLHVYASKSVFVPSDLVSLINFIVKRVRKLNRKELK